MLTNRELLLVYSVARGQLKQMFQARKETPSKESVFISKKIKEETKNVSPALEDLDLEARDALRKLVAEVAEPGKRFTFTQLGRMVRHGLYNGYVYSIVARYLNVYNSRTDYRLERNQNIQDVMQMMAAAVPGKSFNYGNINKIRPKVFQAMLDLHREGKILFPSFRPDGNLIIIPQVPVKDFDTPKGVFEFKGLQMSIRSPYVSYRGKSLKFKKNTCEFKILKELVKKKGDAVSSFHLWVNICKGSQNLGADVRKRRIKSRIEAIRSKLPQTTGCPKIIYDMKKDRVILK